MQFDRAKYDEFWGRGWTAVESVFEASEADAIAELAVELCDREAEEKSVGQRDQSHEGATAPRKLGAPFLKHEDMRRFVLDGRLRGLVG